MAALGDSNSSSEQYAWGDDGQDDEDREPEAFLVDKKAVARAGVWVEAHYLLPPCDPVVEVPSREHRKGGNFLNVTQKREIAVGRIEALEIENCELAGRMSALEGLLREREEEMQALRRQLQAYTQALETLGRGSEALSAAQLLNQVMSLTQQVRDLEDERRALTAAAGGAARALNLGRSKPCRGRDGRQALDGDHAGVKGQKEENADEKGGKAEGRRTERRRQDSSKVMKQQEEEEVAGQAGADAVNTPKGQHQVKREYREEDDVDSVKHGAAQAQGGMMARDVSITKQSAVAVSNVELPATKPAGCVQSVESDSVPDSFQHERETMSCYQPTMLTGPLTPGREDHGACQEPPSPMALTCPSMSIGYHRSAPSGPGALPRSFTSAVATMMTSPGATISVPRGAMTSPGGMKVQQGVEPVPFTALPPSAVGEREYVPPRSFQVTSSGPLARHLPHVGPITPTAAAAAAALPAAPSAGYHHGPHKHREGYAPPASFNPRSASPYCSCSNAVSHKLLSTDPVTPRKVTSGCDGSQCRELSGRNLQAHKPTGGSTALPPPPLLAPTTPPLIPLPMHASQHMHSYSLPRLTNPYAPSHSHLQPASVQCPEAGGSGRQVLGLDKMLSAPAQAWSSLAGAAIKGLKGKGGRVQGEEESGEDAGSEGREAACAATEAGIGVDLQYRGVRGGGQMDKAQQLHGQHIAGSSSSMLHALSKNHSQLDFHVSSSGQQGLGAVRGALITVLRVRTNKREEVIRQLDGLLRTQRVTSDDIIKGLHERCIPLLTVVTPPPSRPSFSLFHRSRVTDAQQAFLSSPSVSLPAFLIAAAVAYSWVPSEAFQDIVQMLPTLPVRRLLTLEFFCAAFVRMGKVGVDMILSDLQNLDECLGVEEEGLPTVQEFSGCKILVLVRGKDGLQFKRRWVFGGK